VLAVQLVDALWRDELDREVAVLDAGCGERRQRGPPQLFRNLDQVDLDQGCQPCWRRACAWRSGGACFSAYSL
jgi:hypothetical protein